MAGPVGGSAQPFHHAGAWHFNKDRSAPDTGIADKIFGGIDDHMKKVGAFFDQSRSRQMVFAWIVMPAITAIAARFILGQDFFMHGLAGLKNPGVQVFMGLPVLAVLAGGTLYSMIMVTTDPAPKHVKRVMFRVMKLAQFTLYIVALTWVANQALQMQGGLVRAHYTHPASTNFLQNLKNGPTQIQTGGLFCTSWPGIILVGSFVIPELFEKFVAELNEFCQTREVHAHERGQSRRRRLEHIHEVEQQRLRGIELQEIADLAS